MDLKSLPLHWLRAHIGLVSQEPVLFNGSIGDNISLGKENGASQQEVGTAAQLANAHDFIAEFPDGYLTPVGEKGLQLSGGQKQRIAIARAVVRDPAVLVLDEATSALDVVSECEVQAALDGLLRARRRTTLVIAHRLSTIRNADKIAVLAGGKVVEEGLHDELVERPNGLYRALAEPQLRSGVEETEDVPAVPEPNAKEVTATVNPTGWVLAVDGPEAAEEASKGAKAGEENEKMSLGWVWQLMWPEKFYFVAGLVGAMITGLTMPAIGFLMAEFIVVFFNADIEEMRSESKKWALVFLLIGFVAALGAALRQYCFAVVTERLALRVRDAAFSSLIRQHIGWFEVSPERTVGALVNRLSQDCSMIQALTGERASIAASQAVVLFAGLGVSFSASWELTLLVFCIVPAIAMPVAIQVKVVAKFAEAATESMVDAGARTAEVVLNIRTVLAMGLEAHSIREFSKELALPMRQAIRKGIAVGFGTGFAAGIILLGAAFKYYVGGWFFDEGIVTFNDIMRCVLVLIFMAFGMTTLSKDASDKAEAMVAARRVRELITAVSAIDPMPTESQNTWLSEKFMSVAGRVELRDVRFSYPSRPQVPVFRGLNLVAEPGMTVALVGPSGCGKSSVVALLERFYDPDAGNVLLDGVDVRSLPVRWLRAQIGLVSQEPVLFNGSIGENIALGKESGASQQEVETAAQLANAHEFIANFPDGYGTPVGEKGQHLSGGQKQRIAIARAVVRDPAVLVMDEATSALDTASERVVQAALDDLLRAKRRTTLVIAHRLSTVEDADKIVVLSDGEVVEEGSHVELIKKDGGAYRRLSMHSRAGARQGQEES